MKQLKELWTLVNNWLGNGKKCIIGLVFFLVGFVMNWFSHPVEGLSQIPFTLMTGRRFGALSMRCFRSG